MDKQKQAFRVGCLSILLAVLLRMVCSNALGEGVSLFSQPRLASFLLYSETGREVSISSTASTTTTATIPKTTNAEVIPEPEPLPDSNVLKIPTEKAVFVESDIEYLTKNVECSKTPDWEGLLAQPLDWDLTGSEPTILIIHTHGTEAFTPTADTRYEEYGGEYRTKDQRYNMISVGAELARLLEQAGLSVIHDRTPYDLDDYVDSYEKSRLAVQQHLKEHPSIKMVIDLHRDSALRADGTQWASRGTVNGQSAAKVMMVVGTNHANWETSLSIAEKLTVTMERNHDGMARDLNLRAQRFNQDLAMGALIAEIGAAGNTHEEAIRGVAVLAEAIVELAIGSK